jgi:hypothetical protein
MTQVAVHKFGQEGREWSHNTNHGKQDTNKCLQGVMTIVLATISLNDQMTVKRTL